MERIEIVLQRAPDDREVPSPEFQRELGGVSRALKAAGLAYSQRGMAFDAVDAHGYPLPIFLITLTPAIVALSGICGAWLQSRVGRKVRVSFGDLRAEAQTIEDLERILKRIEAIAATKANPQPSKKQYFVNWICNGQLSRFAHPHAQLTSALDFACEAFKMECRDVWIVDENGQKVADRVAVAQYADKVGKPYN